MIFLIFILSLSLTDAALPKKNVDAKSAESYLEKFGYFTNNVPLPRGLLAGDLASPGNRMRGALLRYQAFLGLKRTGELDAETKKLMSSPRCANSDASVAASGAGGVAAAKGKWTKSTVTYFIENTSDDLPYYTVRQAMARAYGAWSQVVNLNFQEARSAAEADVVVKFGKGDHGDPWPFDGKGGTFAHATYPTDGKLHFDDDEDWTYMDSEKILSGDYPDFLQIAIHEAGHTIGLEHSKNKTAMMYPYYHITKDARGNYVLPTLTADDIKAVLEVYDARPTTNWGQGNWGNQGGWNQGGWNQGNQGWNNGWNNNQGGGWNNGWNQWSQRGGGGGNWGRGGWGK